MLVDAPAIVSFILDLSDRKRAEEELRGSEARFRQWVGSAPDGVLILHHTHILFANASAARLFDVSATEQLVGRELSAFLTSEPSPVADALGKLMADPGGRLEPFEVVTRSNRVAEISAIALEYEGRPAVLGFARDVTERKAIQARLLQADRLAALGMLAAGVAHEVNNPLAYVLLNLKYLERELPKLAADPTRLEALLKHVEDASHGAERVQTIVRDLRTFARTEDEPLGPVDLKAVVESALAMAAHEIRECATLRRDYQGAFSVNGTAAKLEQVFLNLFVNAAQAIGKGSPEHHSLEVRIEAAQPGFVRITISDTGPGLKPDVLDRAFEPFFTTKPPGVGTGLGLPICKSIVESFGGTISVDSSPAHGTRVCIDLREHPGEPPPASARPLPLSETPPSRRTRLLIVDDEQSVGNVLARLLEASYDVVNASTGPEALKLLARNDFEVVLCDVMMPGMTGMEFYNRLKQEAPDVSRRVVFMTGGGLIPEVATFLSGVERPRVEKPFDFQELRRVLSLVATTTEASR
jgi:PAS domain S-box-containing protein